MKPVLLVTGGCGFIGSAFIRKLLHTPTFTGKIINLDLLTYAARLENVSEFANDDRYYFVQGNICDQPLIEQLLSQGVDVIIHFAAETHVDRSIASALPFIETNVLGTLSLLEAVRKFPHVRFHHVSTDEVYGSLGKSGSFDENSPYHPNSPYSASKAASDHLVRAFVHTYNISATLSHCSNNYGPGQYPEKLIPLMIERMIEKKPLPVYGRGANVRDWLYVDDHAEAILAILQFGKKGETYDIGGGEELSNLDLIHVLIEIIAKETGVESAEYRSLIRFVEDRPGHDFRYAIHSAKIHKELGWSPKTSLHEGLSKTVKLTLYQSQ
jgi:dTDP-glucose 4,6-dehydratase